LTRRGSRARSSRSFVRRRDRALAALPGPAIATIAESPSTSSNAGFVIRWALAGVLLFSAVGLVVRAGPAIDRPLRWVSFGSALTVGGWIVSSILFGVYLSLSHSFGNVYGVLLSAFLLIEYLYFAAVVFLGGLVVDRLVQEGSPAS
jgi:uncharacterized BrkB/YihY/UPF0761 family membrane protein